MTFQLASFRRNKQQLMGCDAPLRWQL